MSAPQQGVGARSTSAGPNAAGMPMANHPPAAPATTASQGGSQNQNLNQIVIDYLSKKGYTQTEATLRREMNNVDAQGRVLHSRSEEHGGMKYFHGYSLLLQFVEDNLDIYKQELQRLRWPIFVYSFLNMVKDNFAELAVKFFDENKHTFERDHPHDLQEMQGVRLPDHVEENQVASLYWKNKYRLTMVESTHFTLISFLESKERAGGSVVISLMQKHMNIMSVNRASSADRSFAAMLARQSAAPPMQEEDEGIPGHNPGSANTDQNAPAVLTRLALGRTPMDPDRVQDVRDELEDLDKKEPPAPGQNSLVDEFDMKIKREASEDAPNRDAVPYPKALARDVVSDVEKIKAYRDRFKLAPRSGGIGPGISVCMFTFHNTYDGINCIDFSGDNQMIAAGFAEHYIRVWSLDGKPLPSAKPTDTPSSSYRLIGHSAPVYAVSFSPATARADDAEPADPDAPSLRPHFLVSASADGTLRLWELTTYTCLVVFKGHASPVWDVRFSPHGHYFLSGGRDHTARLWTTDAVAPLRILAGHDADVDVVAWHPNGAYVFTGSADRTVRMWDLSSGRAVRLFTGHAGALTALACSRSGKLLASADDAGLLCVWTLESGRRAKALRGHARGGVWALEWSAESTVLASAGADGTLRTWDIALSAADAPAQTAPSSSSAAADAAQTPGGAAAAAADAAAKGADGAKAAAAVAAAGGAASGAPAGPAGKLGGGGAARGAFGMSGGSGGAGGVSAEQISCFATKRSPVYAVRFTDMNLCLAGGCYLP